MRREGESFSLSFGCFEVQVEAEVVGGIVVYQQDEVHLYRELSMVKRKCGKCVWIMMWVLLINP
jgi:hypothetical protein